ncbi:YqgE/AlgH family protein [Nocardioides sp. AX2bis]|uniref:YqgE/AlgH family protein n=1 Tax=Nocardioides sp. AX2bis TaxID=2653157 RepID=UPI0012F34D17|nr:YqgE/AlgH family protein [Nocardioides sp. AX2bis]VXB91464.1 conserved hypothetical protein [Nocardioides sp. AX2bis]
MTEPPVAPRPGPVPPGAGMLLVAAPALLDPNFADTVVLLLDVNDEGALGVVLNRPSPVPVAEVLPEWGALASEPEVLFHGGPVGPDGALAVVLVGGPTDDPAGRVGFREVAGGVGLVDLETPVELVAEGLAALRVFAGYAGWGAGQLEDEIAEGSWYVVPGEPHDAFHPDTGGLWREVLRRQPDELAWASTRPADPGLN